MSFLRNGRDYWKIREIRLKNFEKKGSEGEKSKGFFHDRGFACLVYRWTRFDSC